MKKEKHMTTAALGDAQDARFEGKELNDTSLDDEEFVNTDKWSTKQLVTMALLCSLSILLSFIEFPIFPAAPFLKYDASFVPIMIAGFAFGPAAGIAVGGVEIVIHGLFLGDLPGSIMNLLVVVGFVWPAAFVYKRHRTLKGAAVGLILGGIASLVMAILGNLVITPLYMGVTIDAVVEMIIPILLPFNALKAGINIALTSVIYKAVSNLITPAKLQKKGK